MKSEHCDCENGCFVCDETLLEKALFDPCRAEKISEPVKDFARLRGNVRVVLDDGDEE